MTAHLRLENGIKILKRKHKILRQLNKEHSAPTLYGDQVWQSSFLMLDYLEQNPLEGNQRVMDIGCGWGLLGIFCAKYFDSNALLVDADKNVFPYIHEHQKLNNVSVRTQHATFAEISSQTINEQDIIMGSDICFWPELITQLKCLITTALEAGVKKIIIADPGRDTFLKFSKYCQTAFNGKLLDWPHKGRTKKSGYLLLIENSIGSPVASTQTVQVKNALVRMAFA